MSQPKPRKNQITELQVFQWRVHAFSPYNDGWTQEIYRKMYEDGLKTIERRKKRQDKKNNSLKPQA